MQNTRSNDAHTTHKRHSSDTTPPTSPTASLPRSEIASPLLDPSKLNHQAATLPTPAPDTTAPALRFAEPASDSFSDSSASAYLDTGVPLEPASHPTVAETGTLAKSGPGPMSGQLKRVEGGERKDGKGIIKLGSFGGEGLMAKPALGSIGSPKEGETRDESAILD
ncbi:MAG: hypothetical protein TREMPRED_006070 [Tremellales sp. Tagirdzhanova-0007]|nr:MAG: hypothetical protein TREMPRED_006070 [Tremellales sp. Tagirdzhanova-0007]